MTSNTLNYITWEMSSSLLGPDSVLIRLSYDERMDGNFDQVQILKWCVENCKGDWYISDHRKVDLITRYNSRMPKYEETRMGGIERIDISFDESRDAILFKMFMQR